MLSQSQRAAILELNAQKVSKREIARVLKVSRRTVREVLRSGSAEVPMLSRTEICEPYRQQILELLSLCKGNLVRVQEELAASGATLSYSALTAFCRRHGIGQAPVAAAGRYHFSPGEELQHDTSPHQVQLGGKLRKAQTASAVLCYSRLLFFQLYPTFQRFDCKVFLTEALRYFNGATERVMIDNTHVVVLRGTGRAMVPVPEMAAFAERYGFRFAAHELGDANRSARVERPFWFIERQLPGGAQLRRLAGSEPAGAAVVRSRQRDLQEASPRRAARVVRDGAAASAPAACLGSRSLPFARTHGGRGKLRHREHQSLLGSC